MSGARTNLYAPPTAPVEIENTRPRTSISAWWWSRRWLRYNVVVVASGFVATCAGAVHDIFKHRLSLSEIINGFVAAVILGVFYVILANLCYLAGPFLDLMIPQAFEDPYRKKAYSTGMFLAVAIPAAMTVGYFTLGS